jgi:hypothetical protein
MQSHPHAAAAGRWTLFWALTLPLLLGLAGAAHAADWHHDDHRRENHWHGAPQRAYGPPPGVYYGGPAVYAPPPGVYYGSPGGVSLNFNVR